MSTLRTTTAATTQPTRADAQAGREAREVDVVVTHFEDERRLGWVLDALAAQDDSAVTLNVVVADDGSAIPPVVPAGVTLVRQANEGFRAAAARNLGARAGSAPHILFIDGDTVPTPGYVRAMLDALLEAEHAPSTNGCGALVVGARRHADLTAVDARGGVAQSDAARRNGLRHDNVVSWCAATNPDAEPGGDVLAHPAWLREGYRRTHDLAAAGPGDWRLVISAVMGMTRAAFERLDGFDETLVGYGGEDWDLAYRAWNTGVTLRHAPAAIAWHDGPDAGERTDLRALKECEQLALAARIPQPDVRGRHGIWAQPRVAVRWLVVADPAAVGMRLSGAVPPSVEFAALESWLALGDVAIWCGERRPDVLGGDPRVRAGEPDAAVLHRAEFIVDVVNPLVLLDPVHLLKYLDVQPISWPGLCGARTRDVGRADSAPGPGGVVEMIGTDGPLDLESWGRGRWA